MSELRRLYEIYLDDEDKMQTDMDTDITIFEENIQVHKRTQAQSYLHWARLLAFAENELNKQQEFIDQVVWPEAMLRTKAAYQGKLTVQHLEEQTKYDNEYRTASSQRLLMKNIVRFLSEMKEAMKMRANMLQSLGADIRADKLSLPQDLDSLKELARQKSQQSWRKYHEEDE